MKRPIEDSRPIGPFITPDFSTLTNTDTSTEPLRENEIRFVLGNMTDELEDTIERLEDAISKTSESGRTFALEQLISTMDKTKRVRDSAAKKLAGKHEERTGTVPQSFKEYRELMERRDDAIERAEMIVNE